MAVPVLAEMGSVEVVTTAAAAFAITNIDNLLLAGALFGTASSSRTIRAIALGQVTGFAVILSVSLLVARSLAALSVRWFSLFGAIPLAIGVRGVVLARSPPRDHRTRPILTPAASAFLTSVTLTLGVAGDNIALYIPMLDRIETSDWYLVLATWAVGEIIVLLVAWRIGTQLVGPMIERLGVLLVPVVYCAIGIALLVQGLRG